MDGFIIRVTAYYGEPVLVGNLYTRAGASTDKPVPKAEIVNDPSNETVVDLAQDGDAYYSLDYLIGDFEEEYGCKVNFGDEIDSLKDGTKVYEFDVFEPSWPEQEEAQDIVDDLHERLGDWVRGFPTGR